MKLVHFIGLYAWERICQKFYPALKKFSVKKYSRIIQINNLLNCFFTSPVWPDIYIHMTKNIPNTCFLQFSHYHCFLALENYFLFMKMTRKHEMKTNKNWEERFALIMYARIQWFSWNGRVRVRSGSIYSSNSNSNTNKNLY